MNTAIDRVLESGIGVASSYRHASKHVRPGAPLETPRALLKWYEVHPLDRPVPRDVADLARKVFERGTVRAEGLGFVVLHRCGDSFYFLITNTWRNENELWETVFFKDGDAMSEFAEFPRHLPHVPTFCVWELVPVWHEQQSWVRFLLSSRDADAANHWLHDVYQGTA